MAKAAYLFILCTASSCLTVNGVAAKTHVMRRSSRTVFDDKGGVEVVKSKDEAQAMPAANKDSSVGTNNPQSVILQPQGGIIAAEKTVETHDAAKPAEASVMLEQLTAEEFAESVFGEKKAQEAARTVVGEHSASKSGVNPLTEFINAGKCKFAVIFADLATKAADGAQALVAGLAKIDTVSESFVEHAKIVEEHAEAYAEKAQSIADTAETAAANPNASANVVEMWNNAHEVATLALEGLEKAKTTATKAQESALQVQEAAAIATDFAVRFASNASNAAQAAYDLCPSLGTVASLLEGEPKSIDEIKKEFHEKACKAALKVAEIAGFVAEHFQQAEQVAINVTHKAMEKAEHAEYFADQCLDTAAIMQQNADSAMSPHAAKLYVAAMDAASKGATVLANMEFAAQELARISQSVAAACGPIAAGALKVKDAAEAACAVMA